MNTLEEREEYIKELENLLLMYTSAIVKMRKNYRLIRRELW